MRIKSLAQGENIFTLGFELSTFVSKVDILTTTPIVHIYVYDIEHFVFAEFFRRSYHVYTYMYIYAFYISYIYIYYILLRSFFLCYPGEALEGPISTGVCKNSTMLIQITTYNNKNQYSMYIYIYDTAVLIKICRF